MPRTTRLAFHLASLAALGAFALMGLIAAVPLFAAGTCVTGIGQGLSYVAGQRLLDQQVDDATCAATFSSYFLVL